MCVHAKEALKRVADEIGTGRIEWREVKVLEMDHAVALGVLSTPAIAIDDKLVFIALPPAKKLRQAIEAQLPKPTREATP